MKSIIKYSFVLFASLLIVSCGETKNEVDLFNTFISENTVSSENVFYFDHFEDGENSFWLTGFIGIDKYAKTSIQNSNYLIESFSDYYHWHDIKYNQDNDFRIEFKISSIYFSESDKYFGIFYNCNSSYYGVRLYLKKEDANNLYTYMVYNADTKEVLYKQNGQTLQFPVIMSFTKIGERMSYKINRRIIFQNTFSKRTSTIGYSISEGVTASIDYIKLTYINQN